MARKPDKQTERRSGVLIKERDKTKTPRMYKVIVLNDDYTPMDFVVMVLMTVFRKSQPEASRLMLQVHHEGQAVAGVYTFEVAETKAAKVRELARANQHPLQCTVEPE